MKNFKDREGQLDSSSVASSVLEDRLALQGSKLPEAARRLAYLRQIELAQLAGKASWPRHYQLKSSSASLPKENSLPHVVHALSQDRKLQRASRAQFQLARHSLAYRYLITATAWCLGLILVLNLCLIGAAFAFGNPERLPAFYRAIGASIANGFTCGWTVRCEN